MNTHKLCGRRLASHAALLMAMLATFAAGAALAQAPARKPVKWVVTCPAPRAAAKPETVPTTDLVVPDPVEKLVEGLAPPAVATDRVVAAQATAAPVDGLATPVALAAKPAQAQQPAVATAAAAPPAPVFLVASVPRWEVLASDVLLSKTLARWAQAAGYQLKWDALRNFQIGGLSSWSGDLETAVYALLNTPGIRLSEYPLEACVYPNSPPLLRITRKGEQARECVAVYPGSARTANLP